MIPESKICPLYSELKNPVHGTYATFSVRPTMQRAAFYRCQIDHCAALYANFLKSHCIAY